MSTWIADTTRPTEGGYYLTYYWNEKEKKNFFKAFWYDPKTDVWMFRFTPVVKCWWDNDHEFYIPCQTQPDVDPLPEEYWK